MVRNAAPLLVFIALMAAGCVDPASREASGSPSAPTAVAIPSDEAGAIDVMAVDDDLQPVAGVTVAMLDPERSTITDEAGRAVFNDVPPGRRTVLASKIGHDVAPEKGLLLEVVAGETANAKFTVSRIEVVTANNSFSRLFIMDGFMACAVSAGVVGEQNCAEGVTVQGATYLRDASDNTTHAYHFENANVQELVAEMKWTPANENLAKTMRFWNYWSKTACSATGYCFDAVGGAGGPSPVQWRRIDGADGNFTKRLAKETKFPRTMGVDVWATNEKLVPPYNVGWSVMYQQRYSMYVTVFYGQPGAAGFTALPT